MTTGERRWSTDAYRSVLANTEIRKKLEDAGLSPVGSTPEEFTQRIRKDMDRIGTVIRKASMKFE